MAGWMRIPSSNTFNGTLKRMPRPFRKRPMNAITASAPTSRAAAAGFGITNEADGAIRRYMGMIISGSERHRRMAKLSARKSEEKSLESEMSFTMNPARP